MRILFLILLYLFVQNTAYSQTHENAYQQFFSGFLSRYNELSMHPGKNYYENLSAATTFSFTAFNPLFGPALKEISSQQNTEEKQSIDTLFHRVFRDIRNENLWTSFKDVYNEYKTTFETYNSALCPCLSNKLKPSDLMDKMMPALENCVSSMVLDTTFQKNLIQKAGNRSLNDIYANQKYLSLYMYQYCDILYYKLTETIFGSPVYEQYISSLKYFKSTNAKNALRYFSDKEFDSLAVIFPGYKKANKELQKAAALVKGKGITVYAFYNNPGKSEVPETKITIYNETAKLGVLTIRYASRNINAPIINASFNKYIETHKPDEIMEIKEDVVVPKK